MIIFHRQCDICKLCIICMCFIVTIITLNVVHIFRRSTSNESVKTSTTSSRENLANAKSNNKTKISTNKYDEFEETYQKFTNSFLNHYLPALNNQTRLLTYCPPIPPDLQGPIIIKGLPNNFSLVQKSLYHPNILLGGRYQPTTCIARHKVAIIVPYRNRWEILEQFLFHTHNFLQRQQLDYRIYVCEQAFDRIFNKGIVMNGCFKEILKLEPKTICYIMHDVDLLLIDDRNMYTCPINPRHLSVSIDKFGYYLPYVQLVGGVLAMRREHYILVNGYSTNYWGWGAEDDDMYKRMVKKKLSVERPNAAIARYKMLKHTHQKLNPARLRVLRSAHIRIDSDGVNNVNYKLLNITNYHLYTHFLIDVGEPK